MSLPGLFTGIGKGLVGAVANPLSGGLDALSTTFEGFDAASSSLLGRARPQVSISEANHQDPSGLLSRKMIIKCFHIFLRVILSIQHRFLLDFYASRHNSDPAGSKT